MKKCILMFSVLVLTLLVAIFMKKDTEIVPDQGPIISNNDIENTLFDNDNFW